MTTKERLLAKLENLEEEDLVILFSVIETILQKKNTFELEPHFLDRIQHIQIDGPTDYAENLNQYLSGEKDAETEMVKEKLRTFITHELIRDPDYDLGDDEGIITGGLMDSFALAELGVFVEDEFDVYIPDADLTVAKMDTLNQITARVMRDLKEWFFDRIEQDDTGLKKSILFNSVNLV